MKLSIGFILACASLATALPWNAVNRDFMLLSSELVESSDLVSPNGDGNANTKEWVLQFKPADVRQENLMRPAIEEITSELEEVETITEIESESLIPATTETEFDAWWQNWQAANPWWQTWKAENPWWEQAEATWWPMWGAWMQQWESNHEMWQLDNAWWKEAHTTWWPIWSSWMQQWESNPAMWQADSAWWKQTNATWWPVWSRWMNQWDEGMLEADNAWWIKTNAAWWPVWGAWVEEVKSNPAMWAVDSAWWKQTQTTWMPIWTNWMQQWKSNIVMWQTESDCWQQINTAWWWPMWNTWMQQWESNQAIWEANNAWWQQSNSTWWPVWGAWIQQWKTNEAMWQSRSEETNQWISEVNATWWPIWGAWMEKWETNKGEWEEITTSWWEEMNSTWSPVWGSWMEQWDSQFAQWEEKFGDRTWWPVWSNWMKEWRAILEKTEFNWLTMPSPSMWNIPASWSAPNATWWSNSIATWWSSTVAPWWSAMNTMKNIDESATVSTRNVDFDIVGVPTGIWQELTGTFESIWNTMIQESPLSMWGENKYTMWWSMPIANWSSTNATWWPTWLASEEQWDAQWALWEETYGERTWWPMWSTWMNEWRSMMEQSKLSGWSMPAAPWWPTSTTWSKLDANWWLSEEKWDAQWALWEETYGDRTWWPVWSTWMNEWKASEGTSEFPWWSIPSAPWWPTSATWSQLEANWWLSEEKWNAQLNLWEENYGDRVWWPIWSTWINEWKASEGTIEFPWWSIPSAPWWPSSSTWSLPSATWWPTWWASEEQWDAQWALWEETYGECTWWPMWSNWMKEWRSMMEHWKFPGWSMPAAPWWPSSPVASWWSGPWSWWAAPAPAPWWNPSATWPIHTNTRSALNNTSSASLNTTILRSTPSKSETHLLTCLKDELQTVEDECLSVANNWYQIWAKKNYDECIEESKLNTEMNVEEAKEHCRAIQMKQMRMLYSDCFIAKSRAMDLSTGEINMETLKMATIEKSSLTAQEKVAARATFDSCIATPMEVPYSMYRQEILPADMNEFITLSNRVYRIGQLNPSKSMVSVDCVMTALLQNNCSSSVTAPAWKRIFENLTSIKF